MKRMPTVSSHSESWLDSWSHKFNERPWHYLAYVLLILGIVTAGLIIGILALSGKLGGGSSSSPDSSQPGDDTTSVQHPAPTYPMVIGRTYSFESPAINGPGSAGYTALDMNPPQSAMQPFLFRYGADGPGIAINRSVFDPPIPGSGPPDGAQYAYLQPAHNDVNTLPAVISGIVPGVTYTLTLYYAQRKVDPNNLNNVDSNNHSLSNTIFYNQIDFSLNGVKIDTIPAMSIITGAWMPYTKTFVYNQQDLHPTFTITATGPAGPNGEGVDIPSLIDVIKIA